MDEPLKRLERIFVGELDERVQALNRELLALEKEPTDADRAALLNSLFRNAHSLKGAAASVEIALIEAACHRLEEIFLAGRERALTFGAELTDLLLTTVDAIQDAGNRLRQDQDISQGRLASLLPHLVRAAGGESGDEVSSVPATGPNVAPSSGSNEPQTPKTESRPASMPSATSILQASAFILPSEPPSAAVQKETELVRVAAGKLDLLLARSGELMVAQRRATTRAADVSELQQLVQRSRAEWLRASRTRRNSGRRSDGAEPAPISYRPDGRRLQSTPGPISPFDRIGEYLRHLDRELERFGTVLAKDRSAVAQAIGAIDAEVRRIRMQPLSEVCFGLDRIVRDLARSGGKNAQLVVTGGDVELDRSILDRLKDPLLHLVRNAVDHGIEPLEQRHALGKPVQGEIRITAALHGNTVEIVVGDDGAGLNLSAIREHASRRGLPDGDDAQIAQCIFLPGFSTSSALTTVSGRGVGLDAVRASVEQMRGIVDVGSVAGEGTHFTLTLPLTLTTIRALLVRAGGEAFAIDSASVIELRRVALDTIRSVGGRDMLSVHGRLVPIAPLAALLSLEILPPSALTSKVPVVVLGGTGQDAALIVDELLDEQEVVVRTLGSRLKHVRHIAGATILGNGRVALILNNRDLLETALGRGISGSLTVAPAGTAVPTRKRLLLVDDSLTTRTLERSILESAGYEVVAVADGVEAWAILQESGADLVLSDVDMPRMDGFALTETIRSSKRFRTLPVVLVTARESDEEKARGLAAGADAYLMKSGFDQQVLLEAVGQLL